MSIVIYCKINLIYYKNRRLSPLPRRQNRSCAILATSQVILARIAYRSANAPTTSAAASSRPSAANSTGMA
jgi:hypothetical protein